MTVVDGGTVVGEDEQSFAMHHDPAPVADAEFRIAEAARARLIAK